MHEDPANAGDTMPGVVEPTTLLSVLARRDWIDADPSEAVSDAARRMRAAGCRAVIVTDGHEPVGIWTEDDARLSNLADPRIGDQPLEAVMSRPVLELPLDTPAAEGRDRLAEAGVRHLLVRGEDGALLGILSQNDLTAIPNERLYEHPEFLHQFQELLEGSDDLCAIADADYRYEWVNRAYAQMHGVQRETIKGHTVPELLGADYFEQVVRPRMDRCLAAGEVQRFEVEREHAELGRRRLLVRYYPLDGRENHERLIGAVITDVADLREAEVELARRADLLEMAGRAARFGGWFADLEHDRVEWSPVVAEFHGMPPGHTPSIDECIDFYAPEFRAHMRDRFNACVEHGVPYDEELEIIDAHGQRVGVRVLGEPARDEHGRIVGVQGACQDVSSRHERERELHRLAQITEQSPAPIMVTDLKGRIEYVNPAFEQISGFSRDELIGNTPALINSGNTPAAVYQDLWETISAGEIWTGEIQNRRKDGTEFWEYEVIAPIQDERDRTINYVAIKQDITAFKEAEQELDRLAYEDRLTGLHSRNGFIRQLQRWIDQGGWQPSATVVMVDVIGLRDLNDAYGYEGGDRLLGDFGRRLEEQAVEPGLAGRIGGDEFTLLLLPDPDEALEVCLGRLVEVLSAPFELEGVAIEIAFRMGYTRLGEDQRPAEDVLREAERALFRHRSESSAPWVAYSHRLQEETEQRVELARELRRALHEDQFELHFQPQVDMATGTLITCEALLRWNHPERGLISPGVFIPIAEQSQLIGPLGDWVLRRACQHLREWRDAGLEPVRVSVNVSVIQFQRGDFASRVRNVLTESGVAPEELALEITESVFERESEALLGQMRALRDMGVRLSLDDFGTGYSSLMYLQKYAFDEVKIDQGFVFHLLEDPFSHDLVETVMMLAQALDAEVMAEGIESAAVGDELQAMACRFGQGFYYSMPLEAEDFRWLLEQRSRLPLTASGSH